VQGMLQHWEQTLVDVGFLDPAAPKKLMPRLNQLVNRAQLTPEEIHILRGVAKAVAKRCGPEVVTKAGTLSLAPTSPSELP
jgi:tRNA/rRNA methyltransferase